MLPGFRFLFAAIVLSMSILVFGLGAAALLRAAHEQFASNPSWHAAPEATVAQQSRARKARCWRCCGSSRRSPSKRHRATARPPMYRRLARRPNRRRPEQIRHRSAVRPSPQSIAAVKPEPPTSPATAKSDMPVPETPAAAAAPSDAAGFRRTADRSQRPLPATMPKWHQRTTAAPEPVAPPAIEADRGRGQRQRGVPAAPAQCARCAGGRRRHRQRSRPWQSGGR